VDNSKIKRIGGAEVLRAKLVEVAVASVSD